MPPTQRVRDLLRVDPGSGPLDLSAVDARATPGLDGSGAKRKEKGRAETAETTALLAGLQERLYAEARGAGDVPGGRRRVLLLLQGLDTSGKDGAVKKVVGAVNPGGVRITAFGPPTEEERAHDFLWRIRRALPEPGQLGVFNRSHYEDVLVARVMDLVPETEWRTRYDVINAFETEAAADGITLLKVFLHISYEEQRERLLARLAEPTKHWKFNVGDLDTRARWADYEAAYEEALTRCSTAAAPWYLLPADRKWYRDWALAHLLLETLQELDPQYPVSDLDVPALTAALQPPH